MKNIDSRVLLENMERNSMSEFASNFDTHCDRVKNEDVGFVVTRNGADKFVPCPSRWISPEDELVTIEIEEQLYDQVLKILTPMHITSEEAVIAFLCWCVDPATRDEAMAWLKGL